MTTETVYYCETEDGRWYKFRRYKLLNLIWRGPDIVNGKIVWGGRTYTVPAESIRQSPGGDYRYVLLYRPDMVAVPLLKHRAGVPNVDIVKAYADSQRVNRVLSPKKENENLPLFLIIALIAAMALVGYAISRMG